MPRRWLAVILPWLVLLPLGLAVRGAQATPETLFTVNHTSDAPDAIIGNGFCVSTLGIGTCTLRAAIQEASANPNPDTINVPAGIYTLSGNGVSEDLGTSGDLDISGTVTIIGAGPASTIIDANGNNTSDRALDVHNGTVTVSGVTLRNGRTPGAGGGLAVREAATLTLTNSEVSGNVAATDNGIFGGGIYSEGRLTLVQSTVSTNTNGPSTSAGGGIVHVGLGLGLILIDSTVSGNSSANLGGGLYAGATIITITNSTFHNNQAASGAGLYVYDSQAALVNSTLSSNSSSVSGGGLFNHTGNTSLYNVTVTNNIADSDANNSGSGGGVTDQGGNLLFQNTLIAGNSQIDLFGGGGTVAVEDDCSGTLQSAGNNIVYAANLGVCTIAGAYTQAYPLLGGLAHNGGPTRTHALLLGSAGIDDGNATSCNDWTGAPLTRDQRGVTRPLFGGLSRTCDIGAYELVVPWFVPIIMR